MTSKTTFLLCLLLAFACSQALGQVKAAGIEIEVREHDLAVTIDSSLFQNMTKLPEGKTVLSGSDLNEAKLAFQEALRLKTPTLDISSLSIAVSSNAVWLNVSAQFTIDGASKVERDAMWTDLNWLPYRVSSDLKAGNLTFNLVGSKYLQPIVQSLYNKTGVKFFSPAFTPIIPQIAVSTAGNFSTFDFHSIVENVSSWSKSFDINSKRTLWERPSKKTLDLRIQIETENVSKTLYAFSNTYARVSTEGHSAAFGDTIVVEKSNGTWEVMMLGALAGFLGLAVVTYYYERRIMRSFRR
jgi:hypothetical protein